MTALADLQARVRRLEQRAKRAPRGSAVCPVPTDAASIRTVLKMLIEAGALYNPREDSLLWPVYQWLHSQPDYEQEDDSNATAGTSDPAGPIFDAAQRLGA